MGEGHITDGNHSLVLSLKGRTDRRVSKENVTEITSKK